MLFVSRDDLKEMVKSAVEEGIKEKSGDSLEALDLKKEIVRLEVERDKKKEEWDRREREIEHKVGLERKRQEFEIEQSKREAAVAVKEANLEADKQRFKDEMDFQRKHLEGEIGALRDMVGQLLKALPTAEIIATVGKR